MMCPNCHSNCLEKHPDGYMVCNYCGYKDFRPLVEAFRALESKLARLTAQNDELRTDGERLARAIKVYADAGDSLGGKHPVGYGNIMFEYRAGKSGNFAIRVSDMLKASEALAKHQQIKESSNAD